jgi:alpha-1,6-mannosyltransferase
VSEGASRVVRYKAPKMPYDPTYYVPWRVDVMTRVVREERPDVVQISSPYLPSFVARYLKEVPLRVYFYHSDPMGCYVRPALRRLLNPQLAQRAERLAWGWQRAVSRWSDVTVVAGHWLEQLLKQQRCQRVVTVPFGVDRADLGPERGSEQLRARFLGPLAESPTAALVLITGRLAADKRQARLVEALVELSKRREVALVCLGDGPERPRLEALARPLPQATFLSFTKDRAEYAAILASVDALAHASVCETFGFVVAETLSSGTPVLVPDAGGAAALVNDECAERYDPDASVSEIAARLERLLQRPREQLRRAALHATRDLPSTNDHFNGLFQLYERLLATPDPRAALV